jgi:hypothetical protein
MGIMHGDNSGAYAACNQLSKMFAVAGDISTNGNRRLRVLRKEQTHYAGMENFTLISSRKIHNLLI